MNKLSHSELLNIEYKFIFEYYDKPLSFIGYANQHNYLFYFIDDTSFFTAELTKSDTIYLSECKDLTKLINDLISREKLYILEFDFLNDSIKYTNAEHNKQAIEDYPNIPNLIEFDFNSNRIIEKDYRFENYLDFPLEADKITVRVVNEVNSNLYKYTIIENVMKYVSESFSSIKSAYDFENNQELMMSPFSKGSFKVNFELLENTNLLETSNNFYPMLNILQEVSVSEKEVDLDILDTKLNVELINNTISLYETIKEEGISLEFSKSIDGKELTSISQKINVDKNLAIFKESINTKSTVSVNKEIKTIEGELRSASVDRNSFSINTVNGKVSGKFEKELFRRLKTNELTVVFPAYISAEIEIDSYTDIEGNPIKETHVMRFFEQFA
ncbi:hypothetical protein [Listeria grandensis]|uniref:Uncharacterized protein n=1 Tax=Listeria grandensis TaxID=1494963 RepID=A0A7X1CNM1_9LIST|nr:hypothetical protein [Listeria grandensis]MBC1935079.1 hypothetical protein [Listeria grandensis]MBC6314651.1 hypothetical protein [Listeria grandensis]